MDKKQYQPLILPQVTWERAKLSSTYGEAAAQPLEPGFGVTLGNALRRILLGGIEGSAVTSVIIEGVNNEFSVVPGVVEDTLQLILNIKQLIIKNKSGLPGTMTLVWEGEGEVKAEQVQADEHLEVLNKDLVLAHVARDGRLAITFFVECGRGYQSAQWPVGTALQEDGRIYVDATFAPVRRVTYDVQKTRVGKNIDYDKLTLSITTDGTETPVAVLHYAVSVLRTQLEHFLTGEEIPLNAFSRTTEKAPDTPQDEQASHLTIKGVPAEFLLKPIDVLEFSVRAHNCLTNANIMRIIDLVNMTEDDVLKIKNFGRKSYEEVKESMQEHGLSLGMNIKESDVLDLLGAEASDESSER
jgi:DNA-directed RNA polymerase subunit alpha